MPYDVPNHRPPRLRLRKPSAVFYASATWAALKAEVDTLKARLAEVMEKVG